MGTNRQKAEDLRFQDYVTETAFSISLSKAQVAELGRIGNEPGRANGGNTISALYRRGLIVPDRDCWGGYAKWELSAAGKATFDLLMVAGLVAYDRRPHHSAARNDENRRSGNSSGFQ